MNNIEKEVTKVVGRAAEVVASVNQNLTVRALHLLCLVAENEGQTVTDYAKTAHMPPQTTSSTLLRLSDIERGSMPGGKGAGLIAMVPGSDNLRERRYRLTPKGRAIFDRLVRISKLPLAVATAPEVIETVSTLAEVAKTVT
jgi:DNA-binding MarR family transcriptional regulator